MGIYPLHSQTLTASLKFKDNVRLPSSIPLDIETDLCYLPRIIEITVRYLYLTFDRVRFWCNLDCCGALCALAAWGMIGYGVRVVVFILLKPWPWGECFTAFGALNALAFTAVAGITVTAHVQAMITNPGAVPRDAIPVQCSRGVLTEGEETEGAARGEDQETTHLASHKKIDNNDATPFPKKWCRKCNAFKPRRAHHCSVCSRCIVKMDHHCPWVNNCVGIRNQKLFVLFCAYTCALCV
ncbi:unnamed protein product [Choristocarpus tenellus]